MNRALLMIALSLLVGIVQAERLDPFSLPQRHRHTSSMHPKIKGIIRSQERCGALLAQGRRTKVVFAGDVFAGYTVKQVEQNYVCLVRGVERVIIKLEKKEN